MEFSQDLLIDVALNAAGYLIAGLLGLTLYSIIKHKENESKVRVKSKYQDKNNMSNSADYRTAQGENKRKMEFIDLNQPENISYQNKPILNDKDDKTETMKIAAMMLRAGAEPVQILKVLPISEEELTALKNNRNS